MLHPSWIRLLFAIVVAVASVNGVVPAASAQDDKARAIELIGEANAAYDEGNFRDALVRYREAYDITEDPRVLYRIGLTYENLANYQRAREHLELFLLAEPDTKYAGRVKSKIENLRKLETNLQASIRVTSVPEGASVWINDDRGKPAGVTPVRIPVGPGSHTLKLEKDGYEPIQAKVEVETGETVEQAFDLEGGGVAQTDETETSDETTEETADETMTRDEYEFTGEPSRTYIGPSTGVTVLCWLSIAVGWLAIGGAVGGEAVLLGTATRAGYGGLALIALGGYFLWFHDWSRGLPDARAGAESSPSARFLGVRWKF